MLYEKLDVRSIRRFRILIPIKKSQLYQRLFWASSSLIFIQLYRKPIFYGTFFVEQIKQTFGFNLFVNLRDFSAIGKMKMVKKNEV